VAITVDRYQVRGQLHAAPFIDALAGLHRRGPMVPLTDAIIDYPMGDEWHRQRVGTLIVNRTAIDHIVETPDYDVSVTDEAPAEPELPVVDVGAVLAAARALPDPAGTAS
jgi:hypothetical protein